MSQDSERFDFLSLWRVLWGHRLLIIGCTFIGGGVAVVLALLATPVFRAQVTVTEVHDAGMSGAASLMGQLGGLASLAGVNLGAAGGQNRDYQAVLQSRHLVEEFVKRPGVIPALFPQAKKQPTLWFAVKKFADGTLGIVEDARKGTTVVSIDSEDPVLAARWANEFVTLANDTIRARALRDSTRNIDYLNKQLAQTNVVEMRRAIYNLIESETKTLMLANARAEYAFTVVDPAVPPEIRSSPKRTLMTLVGLILGGALGTLIALVHNAIRRAES